MGRGQPPTAPPRAPRSSQAHRKPSPRFTRNSAVVCAVPCSSLEKGDVKNEGGPEATLTIEALGTARGRGLSK